MGIRRGRAGRIDKTVGSFKAGKAMTKDEKFRRKERSGEGKDDMMNGSIRSGES